ncbi:MAG: cohesin domain-containing protein [Candidatus Promineifilaceae bacterium]
MSIIRRLQVPAIVVFTSFITLLIGFQNIYAAEQSIAGNDVLTQNSAESSFQLSTNQLIYQSVSTTLQAVTFADSGANIRAYSLAHTITAGASCTQVSPMVVDCPSAAVSKLQVIGSELSDQFTIRTTITTTVNGMLGNDTMHAHYSSGADTSRLDAQLPTGSNQITRTNAGLVSNTSVETVALYGGQGTDNITIHNVAVNTTVTACGGEGSDSLFINGTIDGTAIVDGNTESDRITLNFDGSGSVIAYGGPGIDILENQSIGGATMVGEGGANICAPLVFDCGSVSEIPVNECEAISALYTSTNGDNWLNKTDWLDTDTPCSWYGITCASGHVTEIALSGNQLTGTLPNELGSLPQLTTLQLDNNPLTAGIPANFLNLPLDIFSFNETTLCESSDTAFQTWLNAISQLQRTDIPCSVLWINLLAFDGDLHEIFGETYEKMRKATLDQPEKTAILLADLQRDGDTQIFVMKDGVVTTIEGLPNTAGVLDLELTEYDMGDGDATGGFLKWALDNHANEGTKTVVSVIGHGTFLAPDVDANLSTRVGRTLQGVIPLPLFVGLHSDFSDMHPEPSMITPHSIQQMLAIGTDNGVNPIDILDLVHCFAASVEEFYELANDGGKKYTETIIGSPNYAYFTPKMLANAFTAVLPAAAVEATTKAIITTYDETLAAHDLLDGDDDVNHPRVLIAVQSATVAAIKHAMDALSAEILIQFDADPEGTHEKLEAAYNATTQFYDTTYCDSDWTLASGDALVDIYPFMTQLSELFGGNVATAATAVQATVDTAILHNATMDGNPWFANDTSQIWRFQGTGLALYADMFVASDNTHTLSWQAPYYTQATSVETANDNPHPLKFVQGATTWADVFQRYWQAKAATVQLETSACLPTYPPAAEIISIQSHGGIDSVQVTWNVDNPLAGELDTYKLYRYVVGNGAPAIIATQLTATHFDSVALTSNSDYCYYVEAFDSSGNVIGTSNTSCTRFGELQLELVHQVVEPGATNVSIPVRVIHGTGLCISALDVRVEYDPSIVTATTVRNTAYTADYAFIGNTESITGTVNIGSFDTTCENLIGAGTLFELIFDVQGVEGEISSLDFIQGLESTVIYHGDDLFTPVPIHRENGSIRVDTQFFRGDINGDAAVNAADALLALRIATDVFTPSRRQHLSCDVNGDGACNSADASLIFCYSASEDWTQCGLPSRRARNTQQPVDIRIGSKISEVGLQVQIPVTLTHNQQIAGGSITLTYDPKLQVNGIVTDGTLLANSDKVGHFVDTSVPGVFKVAFAGEKALASDGVLFYLDVTVPLTSTRVISNRFVTNIKVASVQLNSESGLDWVTNLDQQINNTSNGNTITIAWQPRSAVTLSQYEAINFASYLSVVVLLLGLVTVAVWKRYRVSVTLNE